MTDEFTSTTDPGPGRAMLARVKYMFVNFLITQRKVEPLEKQKRVKKNEFES